MKDKTNEEKGITLVSLIITIVIMLILAFVVLNLALGNNGLIRKVQQARENDLIGREKEAIQMSYSKMNIDKIELDSQIEKNYVDEDTYNDDGYWLEENGITDQMQEELKNMNYNTTVGIKEDKMEITFTDSNHIYDVDIDGEITKEPDKEIYKHDLNDKIVDISDDFIILQSGKKEYSLLRQTSDYENYIDNPCKKIDFNIKKIEGTYILSDNGKIYVKKIYNDEFNIECLSDSAPLNEYYISDILDYSDNCNEDYFVFINDTGKVFKYDISENNIISISEKYNIQDINVKSFEMFGRNLFVLDKDGKVYTSGNNSNGILGDGTFNDTEIDSVKCISNSGALLNVKVERIIPFYGMCVFAIDENKNIYVWGQNSGGELGLGNYNNCNIPTLIKNNEEISKQGIKAIDYYDSDSFYILTDSGNAYVSGSKSWSETSNSSNEFKCINNDGVLFGKKIKSIYQDGFPNVMYVLDQEGNLYAYGKNKYGYLDDGRCQEISDYICLNDIFIDGNKIQSMTYDMDRGIKILDKNGKFWNWTYNARKPMICESENEESKIYDKKITKFVFFEDAGNIFTLNYYFLTDDNQVILMKEDCQPN